MVFLLRGTGFAANTDNWNQKTKDGGAEGSRTPDLLIANETLYQLSYDPSQYFRRYRILAATQVQKAGNPRSAMAESKRVICCAFLVGFSHWIQ